jgi:zinc transport system substrate-binding protein
MNRLKGLIGMLASMVLIFLWSSPVQAAVNIFVSIAPQKYFVDKIGGNLVKVFVLVPKGADPHTYEPRPKQMVELSKADIYFAVGVDFEKAWLTKIAAANPAMRIVHTDSGIPKIPMDAHLGHDADRHEPAKQAHRHRGGAPDPHIWLSPALVKIQAGYVMNALTAMDPQNAPRYKAFYFDFLKELDELDGELKALFADRKGMPFIVFHPSWGYFAQAYGLKQIPIEMEGKSPKPAQIQELIRFARGNGVTVVFAQPQLSAKIAETIANEIGGRVILVDPLALDWAENLREVAGKFKAVVR